jgi:CheY-like chemotaxis protein
MSPHKILVVEDDPSIREEVGELLGEGGFAIVTAANGKRALDILEGTKDQRDLPRAIVLDLMMPLMDGWTFREEQLRRPRLRDIPVIVMSSAPHRATIDSDVSAFVAKPFRARELIRCVQRFYLRS